MLQRPAMLLGCLVLAACDVAGFAPAPPPGSRAPTPAERACIAALQDSADVRRGEISVVRSTSVPEGDIVILQIAGAEAPWRCIADLDGVAKTLLYLGTPLAATAP